MTSFPDLSELINLEEVLLDNNEISSWSEYVGLKDLSKLKNISLDNNSLEWPSVEMLRFFHRDIEKVNLFLKDNLKLRENKFPYKHNDAIDGHPLPCVTIIYNCGSAPLSKCTNLKLSKAIDTPKAYVPGTFEWN